jgi:hypothetical protein
LTWCRSHPGVHKPSQDRRQWKKRLCLPCSAFKACGEIVSRRFRCTGLAWIQFSRSLVYELKDDWSKPFLALYHTILTLFSCFLFEF